MIQRDLQWLNVRRLPAFGPLEYVGLNCLAFLKALEAVRIDRRVMHEYILAVLPADEAEPLGVVEPLYRSLFHVSQILRFVTLTLNPNRGFGRLKPAENQSASNDGRMVARLSNFPPKFSTNGRLHRFMCNLPCGWCVQPKVLDVAPNDVFGARQDLIEGHRGGVENHRVRCGAERRLGAIAVAFVALAQLAEHGLFGNLALLRTLLAVTAT